MLLLLPNLTILIKFLLFLKFEGTGKTFLSCTLLATVREKGEIALATATSGIAATLLPNARTIHSR